MHSPEEKTLFNERELSRAKAFVRVYFRDLFNKEEKIVEIMLDRFDPENEEDKQEAIKQAVSTSGLNLDEVVRVEKFDPSSEK